MDRLELVAGDVPPRCRTGAAQRGAPTCVEDRDQTALRHALLGPDLSEDARRDAIPAVAIDEPPSSSRVVPERVRLRDAGEAALRGGETTKGSVVDHADPGCRQGVTPDPRPPTLNHQPTSREPVGEVR